MFDDLDNIDWASLWHFQPDYSIRIPEWVRDLLSNNKEQRSSARAYLFGEETEMGKVTSATPYIVPFIIDVLNFDASLEKDYLLSNLRSMEFDNFYEEIPIELAKCLVKTYDAIKQGIPIYLKLLRNPNKDIRTEAARLLSRLIKQDNQNLLQELRDCYFEELEDEVKIAIVETIGQSLHPIMNVHEIISKFLREIFKTDQTKPLRIAIANALIGSRSLLLGESELISDITQVLSDDFFSDEIMFPSYRKKTIIRHLLRFLGSNSVVPFLKDIRLSAADAHIIVPLLIEQHFHLSRQYNSDWFLVVQQTEHSNKITYSFHSNLYGLGTNFIDAVLGSYPKVRFSVESRNIFTTILDCEPFWNIPTNLFSFFYGLPDDREKLQKLLIES